ncbi:hypothetical protein Trydic_g19839 [Trypoxylus dichotomus]
MNTTDISKFSMTSYGKIDELNLNVNVNSVYILLTQLCEKLLHSHKSSVPSKLLRKFRSNAFEILLSKKIPEQGNEILPPDNKDPYCHLLAWQFILINEHKLTEHACKLQKCVDTLQNLNSLNENVLSDVLYVLLRLCRLPELRNATSITSMSSSSLEDNMKFRCYDSAKFKLSVPMICTGSKFKNDSFLLPTKRNILRYEYLRTRYSESDICKPCIAPVRLSCCNLSSTIKENDGHESETRDEPCDIWELASKTAFSDHRTWETLGNPFPDKEPPFLSEAPSKVCSNFYNMQRCMVLELLGEAHYKPSIITRRKDFIIHVKYLLVGITSDSFKRDQKGNMYLVPGTTTEGVTPLAMESYCEDLILCSCCYISLDKLCNSRSFEDHQSHGFIFKELCDSINRYLSYYRLAIQNISYNCNLLSVHNHVRPLLAHLTVLASVCKVGPFTESGRLPSGVSLLNYLYQKTVELTNQDVIMVLYSVLYPCVQIYFNRFLQQWIFEGTVNDPYGEFFVVANPSYLRTRGRTYWTRGHTVRVDMVPDFLGDLAQEILLCGKAVNLLKLCVPNSPLYMYLSGKKPNLLTCCLNSDQISALERSSTCYYLEVMAECGPKFKLENMIAKSVEQRMVFMNLVTKKRALTLKRLELEKLKAVEEEIAKKREAEAALRSQYDEALQNKKSQIIQHVQEEIRSNGELLKIQNLRQKLIAEETNDLIEYYDELNEILERKRKDVQRHVDRLKRLDLDSGAFSARSSSPKSKRDDDGAAEEERFEKSAEEISSPNSCETFATAVSETSESDDQDRQCVLEDDSQPEKEIHTLASLDIINANAEGDTKISEVAQIAAENFEIARRNRAKVLSEEMGIVGVDLIGTNQNARTCSRIKTTSESTLSDLERNRLKVMSSEFDLHVAPEKPSRYRKGAEMNAVERNRLKVLGSSECFYVRNESETAFVDDANYEVTNREAVDKEGSTIAPSGWVNGNYVTNNGTTVTQLTMIKETNGNVINKEMNSNNNNNNNNNNDTYEIALENLQELDKVRKKNLLNRSNNLNLKLDFTELTKNGGVFEHSDVKQQQNNGSGESIFSRFLKSPNFELEKPVPMSLGSTPGLDTATPKFGSSIDNLEQESGATTAATNFTDEGFTFEEVKKDVQAIPPPIVFNKKYAFGEEKKTNLSKRVTMKEAGSISTSATKIFIQQSVSVPVNTQIGLVNNELLKYVFIDLQFLTHLNSLRNYFFLLDGEFGRNITEGLFEKLHDVNLPADLINYRTLQHLVYDAIDSSIKRQQNSNCLSFKINSLPKTFNLEDPDVLECLSLSYKVAWPLNVLLPADTIAKYDDVFKFLLKLHRVSWILKKILQELKLLSKRSGKRETYLVLSPQFQKLHLHRHIMTHFVQTLQNYVVAEVLQTSWDSFEKKLVSVNNIDEIYLLHVAYIKNILFMCLLNQRSLPIRKLILKIFTVVLKFHNYLRAAEWSFDETDCLFEHPNFKKLDEIFRNFEELAVYFAKAAHKVAKVGYQPHLVQLLDMLNANDYYTNRSDVSRSQSNNSTLSSSNMSL